MDPFNILPLELRYKILGYLEPEDLAQVCCVSKEWRTVANVDCLWKIHCTKRDIEKDYVRPYESPDPPTPLDPPCDWAYLYSTYSAKVLKNWKSNRYSVLPGIASTNERVIIHKTILLQTFDPYQVVTVAKMANGEFQRSQIIKLKVKLNTPIIPYLNSKYLVLSRNNIVDVYDLSEGVFQFETALALCREGVKPIRVEPFEGPINSYFSLTKLVRCVAASKTYVWLYDEEDLTIYVYNKLEDTTKLIKFKHYLRQIELGPRYVYICSEKEISLYTISGAREMNYGAVNSVHRSLTFNMDNVGFIHEPAEGTTGPVQAICINLRSLNILKLSVDFALRITLHPWKRLAFVVTLASESLELCSLCARTGDKLWSVPFEHLPNAPLHEYTINVVAGRLLFVKPTHRGVEKFALYRSDSGEKLYDGSLNSRYVAQISDSFVVTRYVSPAFRRAQTEVRCYL